MDKKTIKYINEKAIAIQENLKNALHAIDNLGIDRSSDIRWMQDYLHEEVDIALMRVRMLISRTED